MEKRFADSFNRSVMVFQCLEEEDGVAAGLYDLDVMFQNMFWAAEVRRQRVALFYHLPDLAVEPETEDVFITQNMAGNFAASIKSATDFSLFLEKNGPKSLVATSPQAASSAGSSSLPVGPHPPTSFASPSAAVLASAANAADVAKDASTKQELINLIRDEMRAAKASFGGGRGEGGGGQNQGGGNSNRGGGGRG
jgi:uncharacterized membrane protein YgcG